MQCKMSIYLYNKKIGADPFGVTKFQTENLNSAWSQNFLISIILKSFIKDSDALISELIKNPLLF